MFVSTVGSETEKKEALKWLGENCKPIRYALAQRMKHLRTVPELRQAGPLESFRHSALHPLSRACHCHSHLSSLRRKSRRALSDARAARFASADMDAAMGIMNLLEQLRIERESAPSDLSPEAAAEE